MKIRVGFLGAGAWGRENHLPALDYLRRNPIDGFDVEVVALCEQQPDVAREVAAQFGIPHVFATLADLLTHASVDCLAVVVQPRKLEAIVEPIAMRGVPLLMEKPPTLTSAGARRLAAKVTAPHVVAFNRRYFPLVEQFKALVDKLDGPYLVGASFCRAERYDSERFAAAPDTHAFPFMVGTGIHAINLLEYLFGSITECAPSPVVVPTNGTRGWTAQLRFASSLAGSARILPCSGSSTEWIEAHSQRRSLYLRAGLLYGSIDPPGSIEIHEEGRLVERITGDQSMPRVISGGFTGEYLDLFRAMRDGTPTRANLANSINSMRVCEEIEAAPIPSQIR